MKNYLLLLTLIFFSAGLFPQQPCGTDSIVVIKDSNIVLDDATKNRQSDIAVLSFRATKNNTQYALDEYDEIYTKVTEYDDKYTHEGTALPASAKFMLPGTSDKVEVYIKTSRKDSFVPDKVHFVTGDGREYERKYEETTQTWTLTVVSGNVNDGQIVYAVQDMGGGRYETLGKLDIYTYEPLNRSVTLVPVNGEMNNLTKQAVQDGLNAIYGKIGVTWTVNVLDSLFNFTPKNGSTFNVTGSGLLSMFTDDMKAINEAFKQSGQYQADGLYLFVLPFEASDKGMIADTGGDMPLSSQFGYLFPGAGDRTIAHEVGHGAFNLEHPFDRPLRNSFPKGALTNNLMDYTDGKEFAKIQWDATRAPGLVIGLFQTDKSGMSVTKDGFKIQETIRILRLIYNETGIKYIFSSFPTSEITNIQIGANVYSGVKIEFTAKSGKLVKENNIVQYDNIKITVRNNNEADKLYDFIIGKETNVYGNYSGEVVLNNESITFEKIVNQTESIILNLIKNGKYNDLTYEEKIALLIPIIEWKLGYHYAASIFYYWFQGDKDNTTKIIKLSDNNFKELIEKSSFFQEKLKAAEKDMKEDNIYNVPSTNICLDNVKKAIIEGNEFEINLPNDYEEADRKASNYTSFFKSYAVSFTETIEKFNNKIIDDDFAYAIGSFAFYINIKGYLKVVGKGSRGYIEAEGIYYRVWDSFDFIGSQRLGNWNGDVFNVSAPSLYFTNYTINNSHFRSLYEKISGKKSNQDGSTPWDINIVTKYQKMNTDVMGIDYSIDFFGKIKGSILK